MEKLLERVIAGRFLLLARRHLAMFVDIDHGRAVAGQWSTVV